MSQPALSIAYGDQPSPRALVVAEILRSQGHDVVTRAERGDFLSNPEPDLYLLGPVLADGTKGLALLAELRRAGRRAPVLLIDEAPDFQTMRAAVEAGADDIVLRPLESGVLAKAVARAAAGRAPRPRIDVEPRPHAFEQSYAPGEHTVGRAARELSAFLVNEGVAHAHRVRIASAVAELVDNSARHGYRGTQGAITVQASVQRTRVLLVVSDQGRGFDVAAVRLESIPAALPAARGRKPAPVARASDSNCGLGRIELLCEEHSIHSSPRGTRVELVFELTPVRFEEENEHLGDTEFLDPTRVRSLIQSLRKGQANLAEVPPSMAMTIGRILGGLGHEPRKPGN
jgi:anti-sigma regulatory factor (Ser/Thr protein kinase)/CheY-like chemotaxis protein